MINNITKLIMVTGMMAVNDDEKQRMKLLAISTMLMEQTGFEATPLTMNTKAEADAFRSKLNAMIQSDMTDHLIDDLNAQVAAAQPKEES